MRVGSSDYVSTLHQQYYRACCVLEQIAGGAIVTNGVPLEAHHPCGDGRALAMGLAGSVMALGLRN